MADGTWRPVATVNIDHICIVDLEISFHRALRCLGDDEKPQHAKSFGRFNLLSADKYKHKFPADMAQTGGAFFPMQREYFHPVNHFVD